MTVAVLLGGLIAIIGILVAIHFALRIGKWVLLFVLNSLFGVIALLAVNYLHLANIPIKALTILVACFGGIFGVAALALLSYFGVAM